MLLSRRKMIQNGLYQKLEERLTSYIKEVGEESTVVDMGCGEGSFVNRLSQQLSDTTVWTGFDLSKDGVQLTSDFSSDAFSLLEMSLKCPFKTKV